jgi:hypothetical protein
MRAIFACVSAFVACAQDAVMAVDLYVLRLRANDGCYAQLEVLDSLDWAGLLTHFAPPFGTPRERLLRFDLNIFFMFHKLLQVS